MAEEHNKDELAEWFKTKLTDINGSVARRKLNNAQDRWTDSDSIFVGGLFFFKYNAKGKDKLPVWDKYPLAVVVDRYSDGFLGLNLHYMPRGRRQGVVNVVSLMDDQNKLSNAVRAKAKNWQFMMNSGAGAQGFLAKTTKRYLFSHITSKMIRIKPDEYNKAVQLPIEEWVYKR